MENNLRFDLILPTLYRLAKDVVKAVKKRLQHKNPKVQLLALTVRLLEPLLYLYNLQLSKISLAIWSITGIRGSICMP